MKDALRRLLHSVEFLNDGRQVGRDRGHIRFDVLRALMWLVF